MITFYKGLLSKYDLETHGSGLYFTTDTREIIHDGKSYSRGIEIMKSVTSVSADGNKLIINYSDSTSETLTLTGFATTKEVEAVDTKLTNLTDQINFEEGYISSPNNVGLYMEGQGNNTMDLTYQCVGDFCTIQVKDLHIKGGWWNIFYRLPHAPVATAQVVAQTSAYELVRIDMISRYTNDGYNTPVLAVAHAGGDQGMKEAIVSFTLTYKYKN